GISVVPASTIRVVSDWFFGLFTIAIFGRDGGVNGAGFLAGGAGVVGAGGVNVCTGGDGGIGVVGVVGVGGGGDGGDGGVVGGIQFLPALPLFACPGAAVPVVRVRERPPTESDVEAWTVSAPPAVDVIVAVQAPPVVVQPLPPTNEPTEPERSAKLTAVPFGAAT